MVPVCHWPRGQTGRGRRVTVVPRSGARPGARGHGHGRPRQGTSPARDGRRGASRPVWGEVAGGHRTSGSRAAVPAWGEGSRGAALATERARPQRWTRAGDGHLGERSPIGSAAGPSQWPRRPWWSADVGGDGVRSSEERACGQQRSTSRGAGAHQ